MEREGNHGVLAHELAHVNNRDILIGTIAATMAGAVMILANMARWAAIFGGGSSNDREGGGMGGLGLIAMSIIAPMAAMIIQMAISRSRNIWRMPPGHPLPATRKGWRGPWKVGGLLQTPAHGCQSGRQHTCSSSTPLSGASLMKLFSTHPPLEERMRACGGAPPTSGRPDRSPHVSEAVRMPPAKTVWDRLSR